MFCIPFIKNSNHKFSLLFIDFCGNESHYLTHKEPVLPSYRNQSTSQLICTANQLTGFYMRATLALNGLNYKYVENNRLSLKVTAFTY